MVYLSGACRVKTETVGRRSTSRAGEGPWQTPMLVILTLGINMLTLGNSKAFLGAVYPLGNTP
jgi:hypothetical protein